MKEIFQRLIADNFSELAGLALDSSIPLSEQLVNEFVGPALAGNKNITACYIAIHSGNKIAINLKTPLWPWPIHLSLMIDESVDCTNGPQISATLENFALLGKLGTVFTGLPPGITIRGERVIVEVRAFLSAPQYRKMLSLIKSLKITTVEARLLCEVRVRVD